MYRRWFLGAAVALLCPLAAVGLESPAAITVYGAASLTNVLQDIGDGFTRSSGIPVTFSFAASSQLARQIALQLVAELSRALADELFVKVSVLIHGISPAA